MADHQNRPSHIRVECVAGYRGEEEPRQLFLGQRGIGIREILDRWIETDHRYFKVRGDDGGIYILRHDVSGQHWDMTLFDSGSRDDTRLSST